MEIQKRYGLVSVVVDYKRHAGVAVPHEIRCDDIESQVDRFAFDSFMTFKIIEVQICILPFISIDKYIFRAIDDSKGTAAKIPFPIFEHMDEPCC